MLEEIFEKANNLALPSLQDIALTEITISLCKQRDMKNLIRNCNYHKMIYKQFPFEVHKEWKSVHYRAVEKLSQFCIPSSLKRVLLSRLWQISLEILRWIDYHTENLYLHIEVPKDFCWTNHGQIDRRKTAEMIIKDEYVCIKKRFKLACIYCLEDDIHALWENMRRTTKKCFYNPKDPRQIDQHGLVLYWAYHVQETPIDSIMYGDFDELTEDYAFFYAATEGNKIATEYFFKKLSEEQKKESLIRCVKAIDCGTLPSDEEFTNFFEQDSNDVIYFLLSNMHQEDQLKAFENCSLTVLKVF
ncbi:uncharacterized protein CEXT_135301 [Caerostris extrusa]|uniref:Ankyrin repeat protein n=1 Tax=Caerostris extrusa TaxID=172846 RepID=A0AAV4UEF8_CAEEX|nr:uncharacterized protein CEXT_135301 [Caerostris extrusa]